MIPAWQLLTFFKLNYTRPWLLFVDTGYLMLSYACSWLFVLAQAVSLCWQVMGIKYGASASYGNQKILQFEAATNFRLCVSSSRYFSLSRRMFSYTLQASLSTHALVFIKHRYTPICGVCLPPAATTLLPVNTQPTRALQGLSVNGPNLKSSKVCK